MLDYIKKELMSNGICLAEPIPLSNCHVVRPYKLERAGFTSIDSLSAIMIAIPYLCETESRNISAYAVARDYHLFVSELFSRLLPKFEDKFHPYRFIGFADDSPIDERDAAAAAGLGIIGDNMMLITEKYSSYVFLAEIITDLPLPQKDSYEIRHCEGCGACRAACPMSQIGTCLSALTQKKGELEANERDIIAKYGSAWGCDICQEVCPHTKRAIKNNTIYTDIDFFRNDLTPTLSSELIIKMSDEEFKQRAYSWRKRATVLRNLEILENKSSER